VATQLRVLSIPALCVSVDSFTSRPPHRRAKIAPRVGMDAVARSKDHTLRGSNPGCIASSPVTILTMLTGLCTEETLADSRQGWFPELGLGGG
jgi:hypothetical protein